MTHDTYFKINRFKLGRLYFRLFTELLILLFFFSCLLITRPTHAQSKFYSIRFGSYKNIKYATEAISRLKKQDYNAFYRYDEVQGKEKYYRVYVGKFNSKKEAKIKADQLINLGIISDYFINVLFDTDQIDLSDSEYDTKRYYLHASSFKKKRLAEKEVQRISKHGHRGIISEENIEGEAWFRVYLGPFQNKTEAQSTGSELKENKIISFYRLRKTDQIFKNREQAPSSSPFIPLEQIIGTPGKNIQTEVNGKETIKILKDLIIEENKELEIKPQENTQTDILQTENPVHINDILFIKTQMRSDILHIYSNRFFVPDISSLKGENPRVVVDIKDAVSVKKGLSKIDVNGNMIRRIRSHLNGNSSILRIILDLVPDKAYSTEQFYYKKENFYSLSVKEEDTE